MIFVNSNSILEQNQMVFVNSNSILE